MEGRHLKFVFKKFGDFKRRLQNKMFFTETSPGSVCLQKQFQLKTHFVSRDTFNEVDEFCWQLRDGINDIIEKQVKYDVNSNLSSMKKRALRKLITEKK